MKIKVDSFKLPYRRRRFARTRSGLTRIFAREGNILEEDRRLVLSGVPVFLLFSLLFAQYFTSRIALIRQESDPASEMLKRFQSNNYQVLVEQDYKPDPKTEQIRAFSDVSAEGTGHLTDSQGFHTLSEHDRLEIASPGTAGQQASRVSRQEEALHGDGPSQQTMANRSTESIMPGMEGTFKIPSNYRFRNDFSLRYDDSLQLSIARQELAGFRYFQRMLRQIRESFSPPGYNYAYRDMAGMVINQPIKPQVVQVLFLLDREGNVRDVKKVSSMGQGAVDDACLNSLIGQNFGPPPPEVLAQGNIFGINFIFPAIWNQ